MNLNAFFQNSIVILLELMASILAWCGYTLSMLAILSPAFPSLIYATSMTWVAISVISIPFVISCVYGLRKLNYKFSFLILKRGSQ